MRLLTSGLAVPIFYIWKSAVLTFQSFLAVRSLIFRLLVPRGLPLAMRDSALATRTEFLHSPPHFIFLLVLINLIIIENMDTNANLPTSHLPPPPPLPPNPLDLRGPRREALAELYAVQGIYGVREWIIRHAREQSTAASWTKVLDAAGSHHHIQWIDFYLGNMHPSVLEALIEGDITRKEYHEKDFEYHLRFHRLDEKPSTYLNVVCRLGYAEDLDTQLGHERDKLSRFRGFGPSPFELGEICKVMIRYTDYQNPATSDEAAALDTRFLWVNRTDIPENVFQTHFGRRRYLPSRKSIDRIMEWVNNVLTGIVHPAQAPDTYFEVPLTWCFHEIGFGVHGLARACDHFTHKGTNYLFGLYTAATQYLYPKTFGVKQYRLNYVASPEHADIVETINSMIGFSYWTECGLNPALAGGAKLAGETAIDDARFDRHWNDASALMAEADLLSRSRKVDEQKRQTYLDCFLGVNLQRMAELEQENASMEQEILSKEQRLQSDQEENSDQDLADALDEDFRKAELSERVQEAPTPLTRGIASPKSNDVPFRWWPPSPPHTA
jgi:hypothetical protein